MNDVKAVFPGSFDPLTLGHVDIIRRASDLFKEVVVAIAASPSKHPILSLEKRTELARNALRNLNNVTVMNFDNLLVDFLRKINAHVLIRGLRNTNDFEYEMQLSHMYRAQLPDIEVIYFPTKLEYTFISSTLVREIAIHHGILTPYVPQEVADAIAESICQSERS